MKVQTAGASTYYRGATLYRGVEFKLTFVVTVVACLAVVSNDARASGVTSHQNCVSSLGVDASIIAETWYGEKLANEYYLDPMGVWFKLPLGYLNPWPDRDADRLLRQRTPQSPKIPGLNQAMGISFAFWMPSLRWPEHNRFNVPSFRPCEPGRGMPEDGEFIVEGELEWPWLPDPEGAGFITPNKRFENELKYLALVPQGEEFGLIKLVNPEGSSLLYYHSRSSAALQLDMRCSAEINPPPNPSCDGHVWWPEERLGIWVHFSKDDLSEWRDIVASARVLAHRWHKQALVGN